MEPVLLIHGYSSEGSNNSAEQIYGSLPDELRRWLGADNVRDINLSRWISLNDGIYLDDVSFAMDRALHTQAADLLDNGKRFHVIIHSTGALVVRNWIRLFCTTKPCPILNLVHLAGANFGSGLAHIGQGQLARWGRFIMGTGRGMHVLDELEFGSWKTLDLHRFFLQPGNDMRRDYRVQEYCIIGSQIPKNMRQIPIRYVKEDSSDNTVRTSACNLNFNYISVKASGKAASLSPGDVATLVDTRRDNKEISPEHYEYDLSGLSQNRTEIPFTVAYETAHFGDEIGIVSGSGNREEIMPLIKAALSTPYDDTAYGSIAQEFRNHTRSTLTSAADLPWQLLEWNPQEQYEGHAQVIFRIRDQFGSAVEHFDVTMRSSPQQGESGLEQYIEDTHVNDTCKGTITYYIRLQKFNKDSKQWQERLDTIAPLDFEITGHEPLSEDVSYLPLNLRLTKEQVKNILSPFKTTIVDIQLLRLPSQKVFDIKKLSP